MAPIQILTERRTPAFKLPAGVNPFSSIAHAMKRQWDGATHPDVAHYVIIQDTDRIAVYTDIRKAKAFRNALAAALGEGMHASVAVLFASESAHLAHEMSLNDAPDEHFIERLPEAA